MVHNVQTLKVQYSVYGIGSDSCKQGQQSLKTEPGDGYREILNQSR